MPNSTGFLGFELGSSPAKCACGITLRCLPLGYHIERFFLPVFQADATSASSDRMPAAGLAWLLAKMISSLDGCAS
ncbi:MAG TPA: hypothetical protein DCF63_04280 [Planctomycetaceae bacterium]|nr:hypothetical protein [Planctomycetaceae bacterium]